MLTRGGGILNETGLFPKVRLRESKKQEKKNVGARQKPPRQSRRGPARIQPKVGAHICLDALFMSEISSLNPIVLAAISRRRAPSPSLPPSRHSLRSPCLKSKLRRCDLGPRRRLRGTGGWGVGGVRRGANVVLTCFVVLSFGCACTSIYSK